jgi:predicted RNase H-like HicB family nuclease
MLSLVTNAKQVKDAIRRFNQDLEGGDRDLAARLGYTRAWYYDPDLDRVGPSKFIAYSGMTGRKYATGVAEGSLDGKQTEPVLRQWFRPLEKGSPEAALVRSRVEALLARYGKVLNKAVRFCAPMGWKATGTDATATPGSQPTPRGRRTIHATIIWGESHYVAECEHLAVVTQGTTVDETLKNLKEAIELHLEGEDLEALGLVRDPVVVVTMELLPWAA